MPGEDTSDGDDAVEGDNTADREDTRTDPQQAETASEFTRGDTERAADGAIGPGVSRRATLLGLGGLGLAGPLAGLGDADPGVPTVDQRTLAVAETAASSESNGTVGNGARAIHEGTFVIGDSSPRRITSQGPNEVRSQVPIYAPAFQTTSARAAKTDIEPVDPERILEGVESLSISSWEFADADDGRHIGPMAEEFQGAFELDGPDGSIATVDADGVALAAIQGLVERLESEGERLEAVLEQRLERIADLESRLDALEDEVTGE